MGGVEDEAAYDGSLTNRAAVLQAVDDLVVCDIPMPPAPGPGQALVRVEALGICGSDVHYWKHGRIGNFVLESPMVIGHESAGEIVSIGPNVTNIQIGQKVALEPGLPCRHCHFCHSGQYNLCPDMKFFSTPPVNGSLALYILHDADFCHPIPDNMTVEQGALCEPLSVGVYACQRGNVVPGDTVLIFGAGPIGLISMMAARAFGAHHIIVADVSQSRLDFAQRIGANSTLNVKDKQESEMVADLLKLNLESQYSVSIDCCGFESALRSAIRCTLSGGSVVMVGMGCHEDTTLPLFNAASRQVDLRGVFRYRNTYPTCIRLQANGIVNAMPLITHRFNLRGLTDQKALTEGFETARTGKDGAIKVMFKL